MARLTKTTLFKDVPARSETPMDKTTRAAREIMDSERQQRDNKTERLRQARLSQDVAEPADPPPKKTRAKAVK